MSQVDEQSEGLGQSARQTLALFPPQFSCPVCFAKQGEAHQSGCPEGSLPLTVVSVLGLLGQIDPTGQPLQLKSAIAMLRCALGHEHDEEVAETLATSALIGQAASAALGIAKEARGDLANIERYMEKQGAPYEVQAFTINLRACLATITAALVACAPVKDAAKRVEVES